MELDEVADGLYALPPDGFVAARDEAVRAARSDGDSALATSIGRLRRPTVGAWLANLLVREHHSEVEQLVELGSLLRVAQDDLDGDQLRDLAAQRQRVVAALAASARSDAIAAGERVGEPAMRDLESTLGAALSDPGAAEQLLGGRLVKGLAYAGLGFSGGVTSTGSTGRTAASSGSSGRARPRAAAPTKGAARDEAQERHAVLVDEAERSLAAARLHAADAADRLESAEVAHRDAGERRGQAAAVLEQARAETARAETALADADGEVAVGGSAEKEARTELRDSEKAVAAAERALARLRR